MSSACGTDTPPAAVVMGTNDHRWCLTGWHFLETDGRNGVQFRWTGLEAAVRVCVPAEGGMLHVMLCGPAALTGRPAGLSILVKGQRLAHIPDAAPADFWNVVKLPLRQLEAGELQLTLRSEERLLNGSFAPRTFTFDRYLHNGDHREMGLMIAAMRTVRNTG